MCAHVWWEGNASGVENDTGFIDTDPQLWSLCVFFNVIDFTASLFPCF